MDYKYENGNPPSSLPIDLAQHIDLFDNFKALPISLSNNILKVAFDAPYDIAVVEQIEFLTGYTIAPFQRTKETKINKPFESVTEQKKQTVGTDTAEEEITDTIEKESVPEINTEALVEMRDDVGQQRASDAEPNEKLDKDLDDGQNKKSEETIEVKRNDVEKKVAEEKPVDEKPAEEKRIEKEAPKKHLAAKKTPKAIFLPKEDALSKLTKAQIAVSLAKNSSSAFKEAIKAFCLNGIEQGVLYRGTQTDLHPIIHWQIAGHQSMFYRSSGLEAYVIDHIFDLYWELEADTWMFYQRQGLQPHRTAQFFVEQFKDYENLIYYSFQVQNQTFLLVGASKVQMDHLDKLQQIITEVKNQQVKGL